MSAQHNGSDNAQDFNSDNMYLELVDDDSCQKTINYDNEVQSNYGAKNKDEIYFQEVDCGYVQKYIDDYLLLIEDDYDNLHVTVTNNPHDYDILTPSQETLKVMFYKNLPHNFSLK